MEKYFKLTIIPLVGLAFFSGCNDSGNVVNKAADNSNAAIVTNRANTASSAPVGPKTDSKVNVANFAKLDKKMNYTDVVKLLGAEGKVVSENEFPGVKTVIYQWNNDTGGFLKAVFQNGKLVDKVQTGLY